MRDPRMTERRQRGSLENVSVSSFDMSRGGIIVLVMAASLCGGLAFAQDTPRQDTQPQDSQPQISQSPNDPVTAVVGAWELSNADHDKTCRLNFRADTVSGGYKIDIDKNCPNAFPSTKDIAAWAVDNYGSLRLLNAQGEAVIELSEVESGMYDGFTPEEGRYILQAAASALVRSTDDMIGDWAIARGTGKPICVLTLASTAAAAGSDNLAVKIKPGCDGLITRFGPTSWRMDNGELVLQSARGQTWRFEENDTNTWQRVPETADPMLLVRQ
jgi:Protease inhibitor Inh